MKLSKLVKSDIFLSILIFILAFPQRFILMSKGYFAFNYDQGRDFLAVSKILSGDIVLIGQTTGLQGIFYGPWWYYFLTPLIWISGKDPQVVANIFAIIGVLTIVGIYLLIKSITNSRPTSFLIALFSAISPNWMLGSTNIWNPTLTPILLIIFIYYLNKIFLFKKPFHYLVLGASGFLIFDTTASFGSILILCILASPFIFRKTFLRKEFLLTLLGGFLVLLPRIVFEIKNNFLMTNSVLTYLKEPTIFGDKLTLAERFIVRYDQFSNLFTATFTRNNQIVAIFIAVVITLFVLTTILNKKIFEKIRDDAFIIYLTLLILSTFIFFTVFPDRVWDYYLVGLPLIAVVALARLLMHVSKLKKLSGFTIIFLAILIVINLRNDLYPPYDITWEGDDSTYRNPRMIMDYISNQNPQDYNYFAYSPAIFDFPFDYLFSWYWEKGIINKPNPGSKTMYLIIREASTNKYLTTGWYGDKTRDKTIVVDKKEFPGDIIVEKHEFNNL